MDSFFPVYSGLRGGAVSTFDFTLLPADPPFFKVLVLYDQSGSYLSLSYRAASSSRSASSSLSSSESLESELAELIVKSFNEGYIFAISFSFSLFPFPFEFAFSSFSFSLSFFAPFLSFAYVFPIFL